MYTTVYAKQRQGSGRLVPNATSVMAVKSSAIPTEQPSRLAASLMTLVMSCRNDTFKPPKSHLLVFIVHFGSSSNCDQANSNEGTKE